MTLLPWAPVLPKVAAGKPLMRTVEATFPTIALPHALLQFVGRQPSHRRKRQETRRLLD